MYFAIYNLHQNDIIYRSVQQQMRKFLHFSFNLNTSKQDFSDLISGYSKKILLPVIIR